MTDIVEDDNDATQAEILRLLKLISRQLEEIFETTVTLEDIDP